ncbi:FAD:protein FMN transferase [uncultured Chitinophaga sp.]|jgi:Membrane-associated lipoprotein involved in thiamine biosynthesis|uniref:FAD:protein FMN transferase n=1 Tax=uncultured Chitinophaga sp. TaxID=339340 RepID=UPI002613F21E|nr:FAD:protein FMN transferase [uncultured Chitinophaga sp.]
MRKSLGFILLAICCSTCAYAQRLQVCEGKAQGTYYIVKYLRDDTASLQPQIEAVFEEIDQSLSLYRPGSLINRFNAGDSIRMDAHMQAVVKRALEVSKATRGAFDITIKPLADAWGFGVVKPAWKGIPPADTLRQLLQRTGHRYLEVKDSLLIKRQPGVEIDCNGIAQGYTVDVLARFLEQQGIRHYLVDVGGELRASGHNAAGRNWTVGIEGPAAHGDKHPVQELVSLQDEAIATSGNYRRFFDQGGTRFAHTIDPHSGQALHNNIISVTVLAKDCITADGFDNALILMGVKKALAFIKKHPEYGLEAYFIYKDKKGNIRVAGSTGFKGV